jgi:hypothetical protein
MERGSHLSGICSAAPVLDSQLNREECKDGNQLGIKAKNLFVI